MVAASVRSARTPTLRLYTNTSLTEKRFRKLETAASVFSKAHSFGDPDAKIGIISWGSTCGAVLEAIKMAQADGKKVEALYPRTLYPLPTEWIKNFIKEKDVIIVIENNYNAQFKSTIVERCLHLHQGVQMIEMLKYDGTPFTPEEIYDKFCQVQKNYDETQRLATNKITRF